ncbi:MAG: CAP domain-containing protein [Chitinophagaceae bacterium]|nr:CAP domain-containing protein [Chitinophagaceae bacterium]
MKTNTFRNQLFIPGLFIFCFFSCQTTKVIPTSSPRSASSVASSSSASSVNKILLTQLINDVRQTGCKCGTTYMPPVPIIMWNNQLETAAQNHATDMNQKKYFNHTGSDGSNPGDRIKRVGYTWSTFGENIDLSYAGEKAVIKDWLQSEGHCKNIMKAAFKEMGIAKSGDYWVQVLATKR